MLTTWLLGKPLAMQAGVETNARPLARGEWKSLGMSKNLSVVVPRRVHNMRFFTPVYPLITYYPYPIYALTWTITSVYLQCDFVSLIFNENGEWDEHAYRADETVKFQNIANRNIRFDTGNIMEHA